MEGCQSGNGPVSKTEATSKGVRGFNSLTFRLDERLKQRISIAWCNALTIGTMMFFIWTPVIAAIFVVCWLNGWLPEW